MFSSSLDISFCRTFMNKMLRKWNYHRSSSPILTELFLAWICEFLSFLCFIILCNPMTSSHNPCTKSLLTKMSPFVSLYPWQTVRTPTVWSEIWRQVTRTLFHLINRWRTLRGWGTNWQSWVELTPVAMDCMYTVECLITLCSLSTFS
jgi:hypothetical protein